MTVVEVTVVVFDVLSIHFFSFMTHFVTDFVTPHKKEIRRLRKSSTVKTMSSVKTVSFPFFQFLSSVCILSDYYDHIHLCHSVSLLIQNHPHLSAYPHVYLALLFQIIQIVVGFELNTAPFCPSHFTSPATEIPRSQPTETDFK